MKWSWDAIESDLIGGAVFFTLGLVICLAYLQHCKIKHRRVRLARRARNAMRQPIGPAGEHRPCHPPQS
jgi:hypothetical protein